MDLGVIGVIGGRSVDDSVDDGFRSDRSDRREECRR